MTLPTLDLKSYLDGKHSGAGMVLNWKGVCTDCFTIESTASWQGNVGEILQTWRYSNLRLEKRRVRLDFYQNNAFTFTGDDMIKRAKGYCFKNQVVMTYSQRLRLRHRSIVMSMEEEKYLVDEQKMIVKIRMRKWGVAVGEIIMMLQKLPEINAEVIHG